MGPSKAPIVLRSWLLPVISRNPTSRKPQGRNVRIRAYTATTRVSEQAKAPLPFVCDVCIVGGGIVGTALASAIGRPGRTSSALKVALIEAGDLYRQPATDPDVYSNRVSSITNTTSQFLEDLKIWDAISPVRRRPYYTMKVWDAIENGQITFDASEGLPAGIPVDPIAHIVENTHLQAALVKGLETKRQVSVYNNAKVERITTGIIDPVDGTSMHANGASRWPIVQLGDGRLIQTRLLIGADGAQSSVRSYAGIDSIGWDYGQMGIVATLRVEDSVNGNHTAWQRFLPTGPVALLPLNDTHSSLVWTITPKLAPLLCSLPAKDFTALLNAALTLPWKDVEFLCTQISKDGAPQVDFAVEIAWARERVGTRAMNVGRKEKFTPPTVSEVVEKSRAAFPLRLRNSENYIADRVALIGDAAHTVHPLAGQGLNLGLADAEYLADVLSDALDVGSDIGHPHVLQNYSRGRYLSNLVMMKSIDSIGRLFNTESAMVAKLRSAGFNAVDALGPLKRGIVGFAS